jgi:hypothetical protein
MKKFILMFLLVLMPLCQLYGLEAEFGGIELLDGYTIRRTSAVDAATWTIEGRNGFEIRFEAGPNEGSWASPEDQVKYSWFQTRRMHGTEVRFALIKDGLRTQWEPNDARGLSPGNILLVTFLLAGSRSDHTANFSAKIRSSSELADALLMVVTFDPSKGKF